MATMPLEIAAPSLIRYGCRRLYCHLEAEAAADIIYAGYAIRDEPPASTMSLTPLPGFRFAAIAIFMSCHDYCYHVCITLPRCRQPDYAITTYFITPLRHFEATSPPRRAAADASL